MYTPSPSISWIFLDQEALKATQGWLEAEETPGALDSLGLGPLRDYFSSELFPGVTTVQSRIKYVFFLLAPLYEIFEPSKARAKRNSNKALTLKGIQIEIRDSLKAYVGTEEQSRAGIIGHTLQNRLPAVTPSAIFRSAIRTLRLLDDDSHEPEGKIESLEDLLEEIHHLNGSAFKEDQESADSMEAEEMRKRRARLERIFGKLAGALGSRGSKDWWDWRLTGDQARVLKAAWEQARTVSGNSLMTRILNGTAKIPLNEKDEWVPLSPTIDPSNKVLEDAMVFSFLAGGANLFFAFFLLYRVKAKEPAENMKFEVAACERELLQEMEKDGKVPTIAHLHAFVKAYRSLRDKGAGFDFRAYARAYRRGSQFPTFLGKFQDRVMEWPIDSQPPSQKDKEIQTLLSKIEELLFEREREYKGRERAKCNPASKRVDVARDLLWMRSPDPHRAAFEVFDYRWSVAQKHLRDILDGLKRP